MSAKKPTVLPEQNTTIIPEDHAAQELLESSEQSDGAFVGKKPSNGLYKFSDNTWEITEPETEIDYCSINNEEFPVDGAKHRALVKAAQGALENDLNLSAYGLSETNGYISEVTPDHDTGDIDVQVYDFEEEFSEGVLGALDDIRRGNIEYFRSDDAENEERRKKAIERNSAETDRDLAETERYLEESKAPEEQLESIRKQRKKQEENVRKARRMGESFNDVPYSDNDVEDGMGLPYIEVENIDDIENIATVMKYDAVSN